MKQSLEATIAATILAGFNSYFEAFQEITRGARQRFINADWIACQQRGKDRIDLYPARILALREQLDAIAGDRLHDILFWQEAKPHYARLIEGLSNIEIAETFFNSIYCKYFEHRQIDNAAMFVLPDKDRFPRSDYPHEAIFNDYHSAGDLVEMLNRIMADYDLGLPWEDSARDVANMRNAILRGLPATIIRDLNTFTSIHKSVFYRSKAAYLIGKVTSATSEVPFVIAVFHNESGGLYVDTLIFDPDDLSILFSYTRAYFKVEAPVPSEIARFLKRLIPWKPYSELYNSIGFTRHGKTEFYREFQAHLANSDDQFVIAPGIKGMVMCVFTLPSDERVFKVIRDRFIPPKETTKQSVKDKYLLVSRHDRAGRMADTQEYTNLVFPRARFSDELLAELLEAAPSLLEISTDEILIKHLYVERRMIPLNIYFESASEKEVRQAIDGYGLAIKELAAANIFPGDMLYKNFGVTRHKRVVFYDYDEICPLTDCNFRHIPPPRTPEDEMAAEPWYSVAPNDVFPEEFSTFLLGNPMIRKIFREHHRELFDPAWWQALQRTLNDGLIMDVLPYHHHKRFKR